MKPSILKSAMLSLCLCFGAAAGSAQTVTVGPTGQYPTPCAAFPNLTNGETVQIDANGGTPYTGNTDCTISASNLTIVGVNGRPVMDGTGIYTSKGLWIMNGHDNVIDNIEFRNASGEQNAAGVRIQIADGGTGTDGGNITIQHSYLHNNGDGVLGANASTGVNWYSANPYITFQYDEFAYNSNLDGQGNTHNMYMGVGGNMNFTLQYSWTHDSFVGHTVKTRAPMNNILYNLDTDASGTSSYLLDFCLGGSNYVVGNAIYKGPVTNGNASQNWFIFADVNEDSDGGEYPAVHQDLHFINNTVVDDPSNSYPPQYISMSCGNSTQSSCPAPNAGGPAETVPAVIENNIFVGPAGNAITNQSTAYLRNNLVQTYSASQLAADFVDWAHYDFHLASGSPAIQAGLYPPTNNAGTSDPAALAKYEFVMPTGAVARPTPSGSTMDAGAYSYPRVGTVPTPSLNYTTTVTAPGSGTITISGLSTPPTGSYNYAAFVSENTAAVPNPPSADSKTGTITTTFTVDPAVTQSTVVPIDIYVMGAHLVANVTVNPGPPVLSSITQDYNYAPFSTVHLEGPAPAGGTVITLSSSNQTYLYVPSSVTVPQGQISAETGSQTGSLWGQNPGAPTETITATQGSVVKTASFAVFTPGYHNYPGPEYSSSQSGQPSLWCVVMVGYFPPGGGSILVTSDTPSVVPNQTITSGYGGCSGNGQGQVVNFTTGVNFDGDIAIATNPVSVNTIVNVTLNLNGATATGAITLTPGSGGVPNAPTGLGASSSSPKVVNLNWTASTTTGVTYSVFRSTSSGSQGSQIASGITTTTYTDVTAAASTTYYYEVEAVNSGGSSAPTSQASATTAATSGGSGSDVIDINSGGAAASPYAADADFTNGLTSTTGSTISTTGVTNPAPQAVYQSQRYASGGNITYTIPGLVAGDSYVVRLHFAETYFSGTGQREFDVVINGTQVMTNFDIVAASGGENDAVVESFPAVANSSGQIVINFNNDAQNYAAINGIQIQQGTVAVSSGSGQSAAVGSNFANPLVVLVKDANGKPLSGATVTFAGTGISFPSGATAVTNSSGLAQVTASPTTTGSHTVTASVAGFASKASFTETGTSGVTLSSITSDSPYNSGTTVHLSGAAPAGGVVVTLTTSNSSIEYVPASVTVPAGQTSVETGSLLGSLWGQTPTSKSATVTAKYAGVTKTLTFNVPYASLHAFNPNSSIKGGQPLPFYMESSFNLAPVNGGLYTISSDHSSIIPTQTFTLAAGTANDFGKTITTHTVTTNTTVNVTINYNGATMTNAVTVTP